MVKAYTLYVRSSAYGSDLREVVFEQDMKSAIRTLLQKYKEAKKDKFEYYIFDFFLIRLHLKDDYIKFEIQGNEYISKKRMKKYFQQFCDQTFEELKDKWTYLEFKDHINQLKDHFVYGKDLGDDPFCSFYFDFLELEIDPTTEEWLEFIQEEDSGQDYKYYKVVKQNEKMVRGPDEEDDCFEVEDKLYYFWHHRIKIPGLDYPKDKGQYANDYNQILAMVGKN